MYINNIIDEIKDIIVKYDLFEKNEEKFRSRNDYYIMPTITLIIFSIGVQKFIIKDDDFPLFFLGFICSLIPSIYYLITLKEVYDDKKKYKGFDEEINVFLDEKEKNIIQYIHGNNIEKDKDYNLFFEELKLSFIDKDKKKIIELLTKLINKTEKDQQIFEKSRIISQYDSDMGINNLLEKEKNLTYKL